MRARVPGRRCLRSLRLPWRVCGVLIGLALAIALPSAAAQAASSPGTQDGVVPAAGHVAAALLTARHGDHKSTRSEAPFHTMHPDELMAAKKRAAEGATTGTLKTPLGSPAGLVFNGLDKSGLQASDEGNAATPPDSTGAIGPAHYVEMVNQLVGVYDRNTLSPVSSLDFANFAKTPAGLGTSDPQIQWDPVANRWLYAMVGIATGNNYLLFGWTRTSDPSNLSGGWCSYGVNTGSHLQDYPKLGHDANWVIVGANAYSDTSPSYPFETAQIWAFPKPAASDATCSSPVNATFFADATHPLKNADGTLAFTPVPANTTDSGNDYIVGTRDVTLASASRVMVWHMTATPAPSLVADGDITVGSYSIPPSAPQPGTRYLIDTLDGRLTQAVARFDPSAGAEALWTQQTIAGSGRSIIRWYEFIPSTRTLRQQGQVGNTTDYFWNAAISPSAAGDEAALFYNRGSASQLPLIGALTRASTTAPGQMDPGELVLGTSSAPDQESAFQTNCSPNPCRWGDYSGATPDLLNTHVVWGSNQISGPAFFGYAQWQTQNFAVSTVPPAPDFSLSASPTSQTVIQGASTSYTVNVARVGGFTGGVTLAISGLPSGATGTFSPDPVTGSSSSLSVTTTAAAATGSYSLTIIGTSGSLSHTTGATLVITAPPPPDFSLSTAPSSQAIVQGASTSYTINVARVGGFSGAVTLSVSGLPSGANGSFSPNPATADTSTLTVTSSATTPLGSYPLTVTGTSGGLTRTTSSTLVVSTPPPCSSASIAPASTTQPVGTVIQFTASSAGCANPQYEYWVQLLDGSWNMMRAFSSDPTWGWNTAGLSPGAFTVHVWANQAGDPTSSFEALGSGTVTLTGCATASLSPSSASGPVGSIVHFTASSTGCANPQYEFWVQYTDGSWNMLRTFSTTPTWDWNSAGLSPGTYTIHAWANNVGDSTAAFEAFGSSTVTLTGCATASISPASTSAPVGSVVHLTASSTGCANPQYEFWVQYLDGTWHVARAFSTTPGWDWNTAGLTGGTYTVHVWANNVGDSTATWEANGSATVTLIGCTSAGIAPSSTTQPVGTTIQFTASSAGCPNPQYEYWLQNLDGTWTMTRAFSSDPTWSWNSSGLSPGTFTVHVWANNAGNPTVTYEALGSSTVTLTGCATAGIAPSNTTAQAGSIVHLTASSTGCANPQYEYWVQYLDGSWNMLRAFSTTPAWDWNTAGLGPGVYTVHVWANNVGDSTAAFEAVGSSTVTLTGGCVTASIAPSSTSAPAASIVHLVASSTGCANPQYEYWVQYLDGTWHALRPFSTSPAWDWNTAGLAPGVYSVHVWANNVGDQTTTWEANGSATVTLTGCTSASLSPASVTVSIGTTVTLTASSTGCPSPVYEFWLQDTTGAWQMVQAFSTSNTWVWNTTGWARGTYNVHVWANEQGADTTTWEANGAGTINLT